MMIRTTDIKKFGMMPEFYFLYYEELDWCVQIRRAGLKNLVRGYLHRLS